MAWEIFAADGPDLSSALREFQMERPAACRASREKYCADAAVSVATKGFFCEVHDDSRQARMIQRIELVNFMSHERSVIELAEGLTVLVGPNNCGKSALVAALQILCYNDNSTYVLRHGARECSVTVETDEGHTVRWSRRRNGAPRYEIDGQPHDRLGRGSGRAPEALQRILRLPRVISDRTEFDVHFGTQRAPVFLLNDSPGAAADFFASSSDAIRLVEMQSLHKRRVADANSRRRAAIEEQTEIAHALKSLEPLDKLLSRLDRAEKKYRRLLDAESTIEGMRIMAAALADGHRELKVLDRRARALTKLGAPPALNDLRPLELIVREAPRIEAIWKAASRTAQMMASLSTPPPLAGTRALDQTVEAMERNGRLVARSSRRHDALQSLASVPQFSDTTALERTIDDLGRTRRCSATARRAATVLGKMLVPPEMPAEIAVLERTVDALQSARVKDRQFASDMETIGEEMAMVAGAIRAWTAENPLCPTCGGQISPETMIGHIRQRGEGDVH